MNFGFGETEEERLFKASLGFDREERRDFIRRAANGDDDLVVVALGLLDGYEAEGGDCSGHHGRGGEFPRAMG